MGDEPGSKVLNGTVKSVAVETAKQVPSLVVLAWICYCFMEQVHHCQELILRATGCVCGG